MNVLKARLIAIKAHYGQKRWDGTPYITHPEKVSKIAKQIINEINTDFPNTFTKEEIDDIVCIAWLHDVVEDTDVTLENLNECGFNFNVIEGVKSITHLRGEKYVDYIRKVKGDEYASIVKEADLIHNLSDLKKGSMKDKYEFALAYLREEL